MLPIRRQGPVVKLGEGNLGGKARVLPFLQRLLDSSDLSQEFAPHTIVVPETWVLTTECFSAFVGRNSLENCAEIDSDQEVRRRFLAGRFPTSIENTLKLYLDSHKLPLAVRSSALSEDTYHHATAGLFSTHFTPNIGPKRFRQLQEAVKLVFASAYFSDVARYMQTHSIPREDEEMAVALETVVGDVFGDVYYPLVAGVAQSVNYFPMGQMQPDDGVASIVMGLGSRAVGGLDGMRFCPRFPLVRPQFQLESDIMQVRQELLDAVDLTRHSVRLMGQVSDTIRSVPVEQAEGHGTLAQLASVYDADSGVFFDSLFRDGPRVLTFNRLLRGSPIPLPRMLQRLLQTIEEGFGFPVEIEFAARIVEDQDSGKRSCQLALLQARPLPTVESKTLVVLPDVAQQETLIHTEQVLGHGAADGLRHIIFVDPHDFSLRTSDEIAAEVAALNERLRDEGRRCLLLGPGRWGSCNKAVGIPVRFGQIDRALLMAEISTRHLAVEPSQGTHFFHNMVSRDLFFMTVDMRLGHRIQMDWLRAQPNTADTRFAKLICSERPISIRADAQKRTGMVFWGTERSAHGAEQEE